MYAAFRPIADIALSRDANTSSRDRVTDRQPWVRAVGGHTVGADQRVRGLAEELPRASPSFERTLHRERPFLPLGELGHGHAPGAIAPGQFEPRQRGWDWRASSPSLRKLATRVDQHRSLARPSAFQGRSRRTGSSGADRPETPIRAMTSRRDGHYPHEIVGYSLAFLIPADSSADVKRSCFGRRSRRLRGSPLFPAMPVECPPHFDRRTSQRTDRRPKLRNRRHLAANPELALPPRHHLRHRAPVHK